MTVDPAFDGEVVAPRLVSGLCGDFVAVELQCHVGHLGVGDGVVDIAHDAEVFRLAHRVGVDGLIETHMHLVADVIRQQSPFGIGDAEDLRSSQVLCHLDDVCGIGHLGGAFRTIVAEGLPAQLIHAVVEEADLLGEELAIGQPCLAFSRVHLPFLGQRPCVETLLAVLYAHSLESRVLPVQVGDGDDDTPVQFKGFHVQHRVVHADGHGG